MTEFRLENKPTNKQNYREAKQIKVVACAKQHCWDSDINITRLLIHSLKLLQ